jgi:hypothetical protein
MPGVGSTTPPVLNGLPVTVAAAETAIRLSRLNGTGTSRCTAYALPPGRGGGRISPRFPNRPAITWYR